MVNNNLPLSGMLISRPLRLMVKMALKCYCRGSQSASNRKMSDNQSLLLLAAVIGLVVAVGAQFDWFWELFGMLR